MATKGSRENDHFRGVATLEGVDQSRAKRVGTGHFRGGGHLRGVATWRGSTFLYSFFTSDFKGMDLVL